MHESSYSPPLPLNLSISERAQSFLKDLNGWSLALTGHHPHCWSLHFSPSSNCYRWLYISLIHYLLCSNRICAGFCFSEAFILSLVGFFLTTPFIIPLFPPRHIFFYIVLTLRYKTFQGCSPTNKPPQVDFPPSRPVWYF